MEIEYHPAIEHELKEIVRYYNECSFGLGNEFLDEFEKQILKIADIPQQWMVVQKDIRRSDIRRSLMNKFSYVIYYRIVNTNLVRVTVIKHQRRHPKLGLNRE